MAKQLLESDFLQVNIKNFLNPTKSGGSNKGSNEPANNPDSSITDNTKQAKKHATAVRDWSKELKQRLERGSSDDESVVAIENKFWTDFFTANFGDEFVLLLNSIEQLKKDIKILGFKKQTNPILAFLKLKYVQTELLKPKRLNSNTYTVIHNAVAKKLIADSEFFKANDYNIIYCCDFYSKPISEMEKYLEAQKLSLPTNVTVYDIDRLNRHKSIFLQVGQKSVKQKDAKLKALKEVEKLLAINSDSNTNKKAEAEHAEQPTSNADENKTALNDLLSELKTVAKAQAALQFISMTTNSKQAKEALQNIKKFRETSTDALMAATVEISNMFSNVNLSDEEASTFVTLLLDRLDR